MQEIIVDKAVKKFGSTLALAGLDFAASKGINIILGPNGAGKSTLLRCIDGLYKLDSGSVSVFGVDPYIDYSIRSRVSLLTENYALYDDLTVKNNFLFFGRLYGLEDSHIMEKAKSLLDMFDASEYFLSKVSTLSRGTKQKVAIARAMLNDPKVLLLDEPTAFLDIHASNQVRDSLVEFARSGGLVVFVTQRIEEVAKFNASIYVMSRGRIVKKIGVGKALDLALRNADITIRFAKPFDASKIAGMHLSATKRGAITEIKVRVKTYKEINEIVKSLIDRGAYIASVNYAEPELEKLYA
ncbi:MAG: ABC transporter ATP-binding protein [Candidatus Micrarchaeaceae archaeon]